MRHCALLLGAIALSSCASGTVPVSQQSVSQSTITHFNASGPVIAKVTPIKAKQTQKIVISGSGFGTMQPYNGDSDYLQILDNTGGWSAGLSNSTQYDTVFLNVTHWENKRIDIAGFTGSYGQSYWVLHKGDSITINVWNGQTHAGPGTIQTTVK